MGLNSHKAPPLNPDGSAPEIHLPFNSIIVKLFRKINKRRKMGLPAKITGGIGKNP